MSTNRQATIWNITVHSKAGASFNQNTIKEDLEKFVVKKSNLFDLANTVLLRPQDEGYSGFIFLKHQYKATTKQLSEETKVWSEESSGGKYHFSPYCHSDPKFPAKNIQGVKIAEYKNYPDAIIISNFGEGKDAVEKTNSRVQSHDILIEDKPDFLALKNKILELEKGPHKTYEESIHWGNLWIIAIWLYLKTCRGDNKELKGELTKVCNYIKEVENVDSKTGIGRVKTTYKLSKFLQAKKEDHFENFDYMGGRKYCEASGGLQRMKRDYRAAVVQDLCYDVDMENAHPTILKSFLAIIKYKGPQYYFEYYVTQRDKLLEAMDKLFDINRDKGKAILLSIFNGKTVPEVRRDIPVILPVKCDSNEEDTCENPDHLLCSHGFLNHLEHLSQELKKIFDFLEITQIGKGFYELATEKKQEKKDKSEKAKLRKTGTKTTLSGSQELKQKAKPRKDAIKRSFRSFILQYLEDACLMTLSEFFDGKGQKVVSLQYDGVLLSTEVNGKVFQKHQILVLLKEAERYLQKELMMDIKLTLKDFKLDRFEEMKSEAKPHLKKLSMVKLMKEKNVNVFEYNGVSSEKPQEILQRLCAKTSNDLLSDTSSVDSISLDSVLDRPDYNQIIKFCSDSLLYSGQAMGVYENTNVDEIQAFMKNYSFLQQAQQAQQAQKIIEKRKIQKLKLKLNQEMQKFREEKDREMQKFREEKDLEMQKLREEKDREMQKFREEKDREMQKLREELQELRCNHFSEQSSLGKREIPRQSCSDEKKELKKCKQ